MLKHVSGDTHMGGDTHLGGDTRLGGEKWDASENSERRIFFRFRKLF